MPLTIGFINTDREGALKDIYIYKCVRMHISMCPPFAQNVCAFLKHCFYYVSKPAFPDLHHIFLLRQCFF